MLVVEYYSNQLNDGRSGIALGKSLYEVQVYIMKPSYVLAAAGLVYF